MGKENFLFFNYIGKSLSFFMVFSLVVKGNCLTFASEILKRRDYEEDIHNDCDSNDGSSNDDVYFVP